MLYFATVLLAGFPALALGLSSSAHATQSAAPKPVAIAHVTQGEPQSLFGIFAMHSQLKRGRSEAKHVVFIPEDAPATYESLLNRVGVETVKYNRHEIEVPLKSCAECWAGTFQKLVAFNQTQFTTIAVVDYDIHAMGSFDDIFQYGGLGPPALASWLYDHKEESGAVKHVSAPNSGVMVVEPNKQLFQKFISSLSQLGPGGALKTRLPGEKTYSDQSFIREFFWQGNLPGYNITALPRWYNARSTEIDSYEEEAKSKGSEIKLVHLTRHKPYRDGFRILREVGDDTRLGWVLCDMARAAQATLNANPGLKGSFGTYDSKLGGWESLAGDWEFSKWAHHHCMGLPRQSHQ